jgi:threonine/homoserine/homoserine lactone efflux protein
MSLYGLSVFAFVYLLSVAAPGPGVAAIVARSLARGTHGTPAFIAGFVIGHLVWFTLAATGLAVLAQSAYAVFVVVKFAGAAYLLYLAYRLWTAPPILLGEGGTTRPRERPLQLFMGSLALTLGNPKTMVFFLAVLPTVVDLNHLALRGFFEIALVISSVVPVVHGSYAFFASRARTRLSRPKSARWVQRATGVVMAGAAVAVATR